MVKLYIYNDDDLHYSEYEQYESNLRETLVFYV